MRHRRGPVYQSRGPEGMPYAVYRLRDAQGELLYVGVTRAIVQRLAAHSTKVWWPDVDQWTITTA